MELPYDRHQNEELKQLKLPHYLLEFLKVLLPALSREEQKKNL